MYSAQRTLAAGATRCIAVSRTKAESPNAMQNLDAVRKTVSNHDTVLLYFAAPSCQVCHALKPKLLGAIRSEFPGFVVESVDCEATPDIPAQYGVFTMPTVLVFIAGNEVMRRSRHISIAEVIESIRRPYEIWRPAQNR